MRSDEENPRKTPRTQQATINYRPQMSSQDIVAAPLEEWHPPKYHLQRPPRLVYSSNLRGLAEDTEFGNFFRSAKWLAGLALLIEQRIAHAITMKGA